jgi:osmotically-inducible protein OsmY
MRKSADKRLRDDVLEQLDFAPDVDATHIAVAAAGGIVTLSGHVSSYAEKIAAEKAVRGVKGVAGVAEELEVRVPADRKSADDELARRALAILDWSTAIPKGVISVMAEHGHVSLTGEVPWHFQRSAAEKLVRRLSGIKSVINRIKVRPDVKPSEIRHKIERALQRHAELEADTIDVKVEGATVHLSGAVHSLRERDLVEDAAWSAPGVSQVEDRIVIAHRTQQGERKRAFDASGTTGG